MIFRNGITAGHVENFDMLRILLKTATYYDGIQPLKMLLQTSRPNWPRLTGLFESCRLPDSGKDGRWIDVFSLSRTAASDRGCVKTLTQFDFA